MSTSTHPSSRTSWTSKSDLPWEGNTWNDAPNAACHHETGEILRAFCGWNGPTAISGTCHSAVLLAPTRTLVWTDPELPEGRRFGERRGDHMDHKSPCAPVVLMFSCGWCHPFDWMRAFFFSTAQLQSQTLLSSMITHRQLGRTSWQQSGRFIATHIETLWLLTSPLSSSCVSLFFPVLVSPRPFSRLHHCSSACRCPLGLGHFLGVFMS